MIPKIALASLFLAAALAAQEAAPSLERFPDWRERDFEGRWALLAPELGTESERLGQWLGFLAAEREHELVEWITIVEPTDWSVAAGALESAASPRWIRVAVRGLDHPDSHTRTAAKNALVRHPADVLAWIERNAGPAPSDALRELRAELEAAPRDEPSGTSFLPPLDEDALVAPIVHAGSAVELGDRVSAEPGVLYVQAVLRAIASTRTTRTHAPSLEEALLSAARLADRAIAREACLAFAYFPPEEVPVRALEQLGESAGIERSVRAAAFLASTYGWDGRVTLVLEERVLQPAFEYWEIAVDRLGELGDGITLERLTARRPPVSGERALLLDGALEEIRARVSTLPLPWPRMTRELLERAACAELEGRPIAIERGNRTLSFLREHGTEEDLRAELASLAAAYSPVLHPADPLPRAELTDRVRALAARALGLGRR